MLDANAKILIVVALVVIAPVRLGTWCGDLRESDYTRPEPTDFI